MKKLRLSQSKSYSSILGNISYFGKMGNNYRFYIFKTKLFKTFTELEIQRMEIIEK
jgi:hypothetical protein